VSSRPTGFLLFWYLYKVQKGMLRKQNGFRHFHAQKTSFKVHASATPNEVDRESVQNKGLGV